MGLSIKSVVADNDILNCFAVLSQLRPQLTQDTFLERVKSQMQQGYRLACVQEHDRVIAVAGYRVSQNLAWGKFMYVDDLVTDSAKRSQGAGKALLQWLSNEAKHLGCAELHLDTGTHRKDAQRFYAREGLEMVGYHYKQALE